MIYAFVFINVLKPCSSLHSYLVAATNGVYTYGAATSLRKFHPEYKGIPLTLRHLLCASLAGMLISLPAAANDPFDKLEAMINPETLFRGVIREDDVSLLFQHIRESIAASVRGEEAQESEALRKRAEAISRELAARGGVILGALLTAFEETAKQVIREELGTALPRTTPRRESPYPGQSRD